MSLRRLAQSNNVGSQSASPRPSSSVSSPGPSTPTRNGAALPTTPRARISYPISPVNSHSLSASVPFDWDAARSRRPAPYQTPKRVRALRDSAIGTSISASPTPNKVKTTRKAVRKKTFFEKVKSIPSTIAFHWEVFPNNIPVPQPRTSAWLLGGAAHFLHFCVRFTQIQAIPDADLGWEDMYREGEDQAWFDWTVPATTFLFGFAILSALYLFTRTKIYHLYLASEPVGSPHAAFVVRPRDDQPRQVWKTRSILFAILKALWRGLMASLRFLFNLSPPKAQEVRGAGSEERVQQLEVWTPGELEIMLFSVYSPLHALLWTALTSANWIRIACIMGLASAQLRAMTRAYEALLKDRSIIAAEVLHEYDEKFVYPRVNPVRRDAAVMTHQAEMVDPWN